MEKELIKMETPLSEGAKHNTSDTLCEISDFRLSMAPFSSTNHGSPKKGAVVRNVIHVTQAIRCPSSLTPALTRPLNGWNSSSRTQDPG
ncbi:uncharacterized protein BDW70DRAFT_140383 [Aspergillus foveolatus]|uniref:uncharacterized protein n=1 Tax=Aspergillus foveolatus TaxID=210207 RepID=UPI003CCDC70D